MLTQEIDEELVLFLEINCRQKGSDNIGSQTTMSSQRSPLPRTAADNFLYSDNDKSDYDWLVTPPGSPTMDQVDANPNPMALKSELGNWQEEENHKISSNTQTTSLETSSSVTSVSRITRPSSSCSSRSMTRPSTPTSSSVTSVSRITRPSSSCSSRSTSRPFTPTRKSTTAPRVTLTTKPSSTCSSRSTSRPSTPTSRPSSSSGTSRITSTAKQTTASSASTKPGSRSSRPSTPPSSSNGLRKLTKPSLSSQGASPIVRSRPWEPYEMPGFSLEAPSNLRTTLPDRPQTASGRRISAFGDVCRSSRSTSMERDVARKQSCSPSRTRAPIGKGTIPSLRGRGAKKSNYPVAKENQMVEKVVNMRKRAPSPRLGDSSGRRVGSGGGGGGSSAGKLSSGTDGFGFGRNLSKSSIDMALRHMDVKRGSMKGNFRPSVTKVPATSVSNAMASGTTRNRPVSSSGRSESSINILCLDGSDDNLSNKSHS